ncbi:MAG: hypothetical protein HY920_04760 [Elusimicrobia bacterium]|nr:hypothetical protein [Elusimicrobiota bacterium]
MIMRNTGRLLIIMMIAVFLKIPLLFSSQDELDQEIIDNLDFLLDYQLADNLDLMEHYDLLFAAVPVETDDPRGETDENN